MRRVANVLMALYVLAVLAAFVPWPPGVIGSNVWMAWPVLLVVGGLACLAAEEL